LKDFPKNEQKCQIKKTSLSQKAHFQFFTILCIHISASKFEKNGKFFLQVSKWGDFQNG
jgi:hypothetical protein